MKRVLIIIGLIIITFSFLQLTGNVVEESSGKTASPSAEQQACMQSCVATGCETGDEACMTANSEQCGQQCGVDASGPPEPADEGEKCMQECVVIGCEKFDFTCQDNKKENCEEQCNMKGDAPDESEMSNEQLCITHCVAEIDPTMICGNSKEGETGGELCKKCADECVHLYEGPCLSDEELTEKEQACETCEHCYGEPVMGDSGEGWECIVDIACADASSEFGDEPGEGLGIVESVGGAISDAATGIVDFFKGLFGAEG